MFLELLPITPHGHVLVGPDFDRFISETYGGPCWPLLRVISPAMVSHLKNPATIFRDIDKIIYPEKAPEISPLEDPMAYASVSRLKGWKDIFSDLATAGPGTEECRAWGLAIPKLKVVLGVVKSTGIVEALQIEWNGVRVDKAVRGAYGRDFQRVVD